MDQKIIFITGGTRSGKSGFAQVLANEFPGPKAYLATAQALDGEMADRIQKHKDQRPPDWRTLEEPLRIADAVEANGDDFGLILLDCLTLWISNCMMAGWKETNVLEEAGRLLRAGRRGNGSLIIVGNEAGMGIVPDNPAARLFRDLSGLVQQKVAAEADEVYLMVSGIPLKVKDGRSVSSFKSQVSG